MNSKHALTILKAAGGDVATQNRIKALTAASDAYETKRAAMLDAAKALKVEQAADVAHKKDMLTVQATLDGSAAALAKNTALHEQKMADGLAAFNARNDDLKQREAALLDGQKQLETDSLAHANAALALDQRAMKIKTREDDLATALAKAEAATVKANGMVAEYEGLIADIASRAATSAARKGA